GYTKPTVFGRIERRGPRPASWRNKAMSSTEGTVGVGGNTGVAAAGEVEAVYLKIAKRIMPFLVLLFVMAWMDRVNVGFAKLQMVKDLSFSEAVYGFGAGILFLGYLLFEIPSNLFLEKIGARKTIARITILWGVASIATMFVKTAGWFY